MSDKSNWNKARPEQVPKPTYWPITLVFGLTLAFWGMVTSAVISAVGLVVFAFAIVGWIGDLRHE